MCGIFFALARKSDQNKNFDVNSVDFELLEKRGPNSFEILHFDILNGSYTLYFAASVLALRGADRIVKQPIHDDTNDNVLLWNGEVYTSDLMEFNGETDNDGVVLFDNLTKSQTEDDVLSLLSSIKGPYSFSFYSKKLNSIYYGRDRIGRRSLLVNATKSDDLFMLSSVRISYNKKPCEFDELNANGVFKIDLTEPFTGQRQIEWSRDGPLIDKISKFNENYDDYDESRFAEIYDEFKALLRQSMTRRLRPLPRFCKECFRLHNLSHKYHRDDDGEATVRCTHAKVALLFSGGLDSAVLAALMDEVLPEDEPIDLLNVAFEQHTKEQSKEFHVPDRVSGLHTFTELSQTKRKWNFVEINVRQDELKDCREKYIKSLIYPLDTVLDDSIGCALWFASRGTGHVNATSFQSNAEIILLGIGADEQLGGYARHRTRFRVDGLNGLINELKLEMNRISERNLGRDDRILSFHGKESRLPYLDEDLIDFLNKLNVLYKCNLDLPKGEGDKYILRRFAKSLGLDFASCLAKRAIQFGSRVAKLESSKEKASDKCSRLKTNDED